MVSEFTQKYSDALLTTILESIVDCDPYRLLPHTNNNPFVFAAQRIFMNGDNHVLVYVARRRNNLDQYVCNQRYTGYVSIDGDQWNFSVVSGNQDGTTIDEWYKE